MTISILKAESFQPLGPAIKRVSKPAPDPVQVRPGVFQGVDGRMFTDFATGQSVAPSPKASKPAAPKYYCETCCDRGEVLVQSHDVCYRERMETCPDCDGEEPPAAALGDWIDMHDGMPDAKAGAYRFRRKTDGGAGAATFHFSLRSLFLRSDYDQFQYRLIPTEAA